MFLVRIFFLASTSIYAYSQDDNSASDILFLKIQELEIEIAELRNQVESQNHLIEKLLKESSEESDKGSTIIKDISADNAIRFKGVSDSKSKEDVYSAATKYLENQNYDDAFKLFKFFTETFVDEQKTPLAFFWLGEISLINNDIEKSKGYFLDLVSSYPDHYRVPLAHKKIGDIYLKNNDVVMAIDRYNYVIREYPNNAASSQALQLLKNME
jgi:tol-pal system protein YbgF